MVDSALLQQILLLDAASRLELVRAIEVSLRDEGFAPQVLEEIDRRLAQLGAAPSADSMSSGDFIRRLRARHSA